MKKKLGIVLLTLAVLIISLLLGKVIKKEQVIFINEVRSWDASIIRDGYYGSDYIELYNDSEEDISLNGWYVSDDAKDLKKCQIYDVIIEAKGYLLLYANGKNDSGVSLNFKLNPAGEKIYLSDAEGYLVDSVSVPKQEFGTVYARVTDGEKEWCVKEETTDFSNNDAKIMPVKNLKKPVFSHVSGFYEEPFILQLTAGENETIYYTLDGSKPTRDSAVYENGIYIENISDQPNRCGMAQKVVTDWLVYEPDPDPVDKAMIVRAVAMNDKNQISDIVTHTYFVDEEQYKEVNVLSIVADYEELFGSKGIFVTGDGYDAYYLSNGATEWVQPNFLMGGRKWEVPGNIQLLECGEETLNQEVGIRTQGASTRLVPKKRMSIFSREEYSGNQYFEELTFDGKRIHSFSLNNSIANVVLSELVKDRNMAVQDAKETITFLNGEYWYRAYALEKYNKYYLEEHYGVNQDNVMIIKNQGINEGPDNSYEIYGQLLGYVANTDLSDLENYEMLEQMADMQSYIDYICANVYLNNMDFSETKNYLLWRTIISDGTEKGDGRWRWMIYDTDCLEWMDKTYYDAEERAEVNSFSKTMEYTGTAVNDFLLYSSVKNSSKFCQQFVLSFMDMANVNFSMENVEKVFAKWNSTSDIFGDFFGNRFDYVVSYLAEEFELIGTLENVTLKVNDVESGKIKLNTTIPDLSKGSWTGKYYTDYPITVTAVPEDGYEFVGWSGSVISSSATMDVEVVTGGITLEAVFERVANLEEDR